MSDEISEIVKTPLVHPDLTMAEVTGDIIKPMERFPSPLWFLAFVIAFAMLGIGGFTVFNQLEKGIGILGLNHPVGWGVYITNFVFWIGIGHAGTLISAILFLLRQRWRTSINRSAEAMTLFAVVTAMLFPLMHVGRPWVAFWLIPYPNERSLWVNFRSPLMWDVFAVSTYGLISLMFWYQGLLPDLATIRDRAKDKLRKLIFGTLSLGWTGSHRNWNHYEKSYLLFAGLATPLVLSVHSVVATDFAVSLLPGWHTTIFPPYFVAGAIFSGFAMVMTLIIIMRKAFKMEKYITVNHLELMNKIILLTSLFVGYSYLTEIFIAWYSGNQFELFTFLNRAFGPYAVIYWIMITCNVVIPQLFWSKKMRRSVPIMFIISIFINVGMWCERFNIIVTSLHRDFLPSAWGMYTPTAFDWGMTIGSFGLFFALFLLFVRLFPTISIAEIKGVLIRPFVGAKQSG